MVFRKSTPTSVLLCILLLWVPAGHADSSYQAELQGTLRKVVKEASHPLMLWPSFPPYKAELAALYEPINYQPLWFENGQPRTQAREVIDLLLAAKTRGLNPSDYDARTLDERWHALVDVNAEPPSGHEVALFDAMLTVAMLRHVSDLHFGRVNPENLSFGIDIAHRRFPLSRLVKEAIDNDRVAGVVADAEPVYPIYWRLTWILRKYQRIAADGRWRALPLTTRVKPGQPFGEASTLQAMLTLYGDFREGSVDAPRAQYYEGSLVTAVRRFQERHGLAADGAIGAKTLAALNVSPAKRVRQIELALERIRWLPDLGDSPFLVANIPSFQVSAMASTQREHPELRMNIVVGSALDTRTPVFMKRMRYVVLSPYWNLPYSIVIQEIVPALEKNPNYLEGKQMEIVDRFDESATVFPVNEDTLRRLRSGALMVRQRPGEHNSLGLVKFMFPNKDHVYMHGTPHKELFDRDRRDFSHGCIRLEDPVGMAEFVLQEQPEWDRQLIVETMRGGVETRVDLKKSIPVVIFYATVSVDPDGRVYFYDDIYGHDVTLDNALQAGYPFPR